MNSLGLDLAGEYELRALAAAFSEHAAAPWSAEPLLGVDAVGDESHPVLNPADRRDVVGHCRDATLDDVQAALAAASAAATWPVKIASGKFHGLMQTTGPSGRWLALSKSRRTCCA